MKETPGKEMGASFAEGSHVLKCSLCDKLYRIHPDKLPPGVSSFNCRKCGSLVPIVLPGEEQAPPEDALTVLVVVNEQALGHLIVRILQRNGFKGQLVYTGAEGLQLMSSQPPDVVLSSVVLSDMLGYEMIDRMRETLGETHVPSILLASLHHGTRYKRAPTSLYGADDYIERHHLPDMLINKIRRCVGGKDDSGDAPGSGPQAVGPPADLAVDDRREIEDIHQKTLQQIGEPFEEDVRRMCRIIVGDIALYNEDAIRGSVPDAALALIKDDLGEGVMLLKTRFPGYGGSYETALREEMLALLRSRGVGTVVIEGD